MFAHKEISHKVRGPTRSENARPLLVWVYRERCVHILYAFLACYTQCLCSFCTAKASLRPPLHHATCSLVKTSRIRQSQSRDEDLTAICDRTIGIDQLPVGLLAQLVERCTGIAEVMGSNPVRAWIFFRSYLQLLVSVVFLAARIPWFHLSTAVQICEFSYI